MSEMVERVARAVSGANDPDGRQWYHVNPEYWESLARAAIEAMREPTAAMLEAGDFDLEGEHTPANSVAATAQVWSGMIDEALK